MLDAWVSDHLSTAIHLSGSAPIGPVVDGEGRVHGVHGLRVADTSLLPMVPSRGPFNTAVFIGEFIARCMLNSTSE
jgi:choline dehydrogenase